MLWFFGKVLAFIFVFIWLRGTLPRLRYDQFMKFGWKVLIPVSLVWIVAVGRHPHARARGHASTERLICVAAVGVVAVCPWCSSSSARRSRTRTATEPTSEPEAFDAFAGGYPVPPMPGRAGGRSRPADASDLRGDRPMTSRKETVLGPGRRLRGDLPDDVPKVVTEQYPVEKKPTAPRFHGRHQLNR